MAMTKVKGLQMWCKKMVEGYRDVEVTDMSSSWKSGLAFCAIIHRFRPDLIDYDSLSKENVHDNNQLAFEVAENELSIPAFLEADDMVAIKVPDKLSIVTYVSQYYNYFHNKPQLGGPGVKKAGSLKRPQTGAHSPGPEAKRLMPNKDQAPAKNSTLTLGDKCHICDAKVYLLERHIDNGKLYHRTCFRQNEDSPTKKIYQRPNVQSLAKQEEPETNFWQRRNKDNDKAANIMSKISELSKQDKPTVIKSKGKESDSKSSPFNSNLHKKDKVSVIDTQSESKQTETTNVIKPSDNRKKEQMSPDSVNLKNHLSLLGKQTNDQVEVKGHKSGQNDNKALKRPKDDPVPADQSKHQKTNEKKTSAEAPTFLRKPVSGHEENRTSEQHKLSTTFNQKQERMGTGDSAAVNRPQPKPRGKGKIVEISTSEKPPPLPQSQPPKMPLTDDSKTKMQKPVLSPRQVHGKVLSANDIDSKGEKLILSPTSPRSGMQKHTNSNTGKKDNPQINIVKQHEFDHKPELRPRSLPPSRPSSSVTTKPSASDIQSDKKAQSGKESLSQKPFVSRDNEQSFVHDKQDNRKKHAQSQPPTSSPGNTPPQKPRRGLVDSHPKTLDQALGFTEQKSKDSEFVAVMVRPQSNDTPHDKQVLSGLLKNLANVRKKENTPVDPKPGEATVNVTVDSGHKSVSILTGSDKADASKKEQILKPINENLGVKMKPNQTKKSEVKDEHSSVVSGDGIPEWKKRLAENRKKLQDRVELENKEKTEQGKASPIKPKELPSKAKDQEHTGIPSEKQKPPRPQTPETLKTRKDHKSEGHNEVERGSKFRNDDLKGPHKPVKTSPTSFSDHKLISKPDAPVLVHLESSGGPVSIQGKKKIPLGMKFDFDSDIVQDKKSSPKTPPPRPPQPASVPSSTGHYGKATQKSPLKSPLKRQPTLETDAYKKMSPFEIQKNLSEIDQKLTELELHGRTLEESIRTVPEEDEDLMIEWFNLVSKKNDLVRKEADLIYAARSKELETEQDDIDQKLRELMEKPDAEKTELEREEEEYLIQKKLEIVDQRNIIVDSQDEDRIRYIEEDKNIAQMLVSKDHGHKTQSFTAWFSKSLVNRF